MTDRELLEAAAKAAEIEVAPWYPGCGDALALVDTSAGHLYWNPLADDGDALRLQVRLWIQLCYFENVTCASVGGSAMPWVEEPVGSNKEASARRAIVRAAAAMVAK
jgi:hypothetical protein